MNGKRTRQAPGKRLLKRKRRRLSVLAVLLLAAGAVTLPFAVKAMAQDNGGTTALVGKAWQPGYSAFLSRGEATGDGKRPDPGPEEEVAEPPVLLPEGGEDAAEQAPEPPPAAEKPPAQPVEPPPAREPEDKPATPTLPVPPRGDDLSEGWMLRVVNPWNPLPADYEVTLTQLKSGHSVDTRCYPDLQEMMDDCRAAGLSPIICSSYRTQEKQETLFHNKVSRLMAQGYSAEAARIEAGKIVAVPGISEHQLGLAVDIVDKSNQNLDKTQEDTAVQKWLMENSWKYGFILRYPSGKSDITGIIYEPWHYRYVGKDAAMELYEQEICLEEYLMQ